MQLKTATLYDLLQADAQGIYSRWCDALRLLREVSAPSARKMYIDELTECWAKAQELLSTGQLNGKTLPMVQIILSRPVDQWVILHRNPHSPVVKSR